jgi:acyl carrier protein
VIASTHRVRPGDVDGDVPIGTTVARTRIVIMLNGRQCADGETGELCIAGDGLAIGYLGDDELTAAKFVVHPVDGQPTRLYRTGDLASVGPDGILRFHGRMDRQVKVRGHRIEPAGIERVAEAVAGVRRAAVVPVRDENGNCTALALFHLSEDEDALRAALRAELPAYSVPDHVIGVSEFPLSTNGKVDKSALLREHEAQWSRPTLVVAAGGTVEEIVAAEAGSLLGQAAIDPAVSLFALGATSLDAVRLCARLSTRLDRYIPVSALLRAPTVHDLAHWLAGRSASRASSASGSGTPLTATQHSFLLSHLISGNDTANFCVQNWVLDTRPRVDALRAAVQDVHRRHGYLSARYTSTDRTLLEPSEEPAEFVEITGGLAELDAALHAPFDLAKGLVWRAVLAGEAGVFRFGIAVHHIAFDGWSQHLLTADLGLAYAARCTKDEPVFPQPVPGTTATFDMLTGLADAADLDAQRTYWANALRDLPPMNWPAPGRAGVLPRVVEHPVELAAIDESARANETSRLAVLLAAVAEAIVAGTGQVDFGVGVPVNRRGTEELQRPIGCLIDTVCVRVGADTSVKRAVRDALANGDVSFPEVVRLAKPARSARHPLYQVIVAVQDSPRPELRLSGCDTRIGRQDEIPWTRAEFVVELFVTDDGPARLRFTHDPAVLADDLVTELIQQVRERLDSHRWE